MSEVAALTRPAMLAALCAYFEQTGSYHTILTNVPYGSDTLDLVLIEDGNKYSVVCFHPTYLKQAVSRTREAALAADRVYLCIPETKWAQMSKKSIHEQGIGLLVLTRGNTVKRILNPMVTGAPLSAYRKKLQDGINLLLQTPTPNQVRKEL